MENTPAENLHTGDKVTVFSWKERMAIQEAMTPMGPMQMIQHHKSNGLVGDVLEILAVDFPFIAIKILSGSHFGKKGNLDIRECKLKKLNSEYVKALEHQKETVIDEGIIDEVGVQSIPIPPELLGFLEGLSEQKGKRTPRGRRKPKKSHDEET